MIWSLKKAYYRIVQYFIRLGSKFMKFKEPKITSGAGSTKKLPDIMKSKGVNKALIVTDKGLINTGILKDLFENLTKNDINYVIYDGVQPNPTIENIEEALKLYLENSCKGVVAIGGGSPMDCAKMAAARVTNSDMQVKDFRGLLKVKKALPPVFAIPTTAGTGSETTIAAVVTDSSTHEKYAVMDFKLVPDFAILDPELTIGLPPHITSTTGMDALTHAVEAYIGKNGTSYTDKNAVKAVKMIFDNLELVYKDGTNIEARNEMMLASHYAGIAFTRAYVGYVHAIAHNLGGMYGVPHGFANAVILPYILEFYGESSYHKLAELCIAAGIGSKDESEETLALKFIDKVKTMNKNMNIPIGIKEIKGKDIPLIVKRVLKEGNPGYPVPKIMSPKECEAILRKLMI